MNNQNNKYINSVNLNANSDFPYLVLNVENDTSVPLNPGFGVMHWHDDLQFIYVQSGKIYVQTLEDKTKLNAGEGIFINKQVIHFVERCNACKYKSFVFPEHFVSFYAGSIAGNLTQNITNNEAINTISLRPKTNWQAQALRILNKLCLLENVKDANTYPYEVLLLLSQIWLILLKNANICSSKNNTKADVTSMRMQKFLSFIEAHYSQDVTLDALADSANVSKSECLRCFKATLNTTPYKYLMNYRLSQAGKMLRDSTLSISEIAHQSGFKQQSYFGKCFKNKTGMTPREYRLNSQKA